MKKTLLLALAVFLLPATAALAQDQASPTAPATTTPSGLTPKTDTQAIMAHNNETITVRGCLQPSGKTFSITDNGKTYQVIGNRSELQKHVNQTVSVVGRASEASSSNASNSARQDDTTEQGSARTTSSNSGTSSGPGAVGTTNATQTLMLGSIQEISSSCGSGS